MSEEKGANSWGPFIAKFIQSIIIYQAPVLCAWHCVPCWGDRPSAWPQGAYSPAWEVERKWLSKHPEQECPGLGKAKQEATFQMSEGAEVTTGTETSALLHVWGKTRRPSWPFLFSPRTHSFIYPFNWRLLRAYHVPDLAYTRETKITRT